MKLLAAALLGARVMPALLAGVGILSAFLAGYLVAQVEEVRKETE